MNKIHNTKQLILFKDIFGKKVEADFRGGEVSSDAGLLFLREVERQVGLFHKAKGWPQPKRIIIKVECNALGLFVRYVVTNLEHWNKRFIYETAYCGRGAMELLIKEHKTHLLSDRTSCSRFEANQFRLFLHSMAYVLLHAFRHLHLKGSQWAHAQFDTYDSNS